MSTKGNIWSLNLFSVQGIPVRLHMTFFLLLLWVGYSEASSSNSAQALNEVFLVIIIFTCVLLHELGHALVARKFRIRTRDIVLYPFGGVASLIDQTNAKAEFFIAIAGPMVNFIIAFILWNLLGIENATDLIHRSDIWSRTLAANLVLAIFNLIPAFPMDGGRILRSALSLLGLKSSTLIATRLSQVISVLLGLFALYNGQVILMIIALIVFNNAVQEYVNEKTKSAAQGLYVKDVMTSIENLQTFTHGMTVSQALKLAMRSLQNNFPVLHNTDVIGVLDKETLMQNAALEGDEAYISGLMSRNYSFASEGEPIEAVLQRMNDTGADFMLVKNATSLSGMLFKEQLVEYLLIQQMRERAKTQASLDREEF